MFDRQLLSLPGARGALALCAAASAVRAALTVAQALALSAAIVNVWGGADGMSQLPLVAAFAGCFFLREAVRVFLEARMEAYAHDAATGLRERLIAELFDNGSSLVAVWGSAAVAESLVSGAERVESYIAIVVPKTVSLVVGPLCLVVAVFSQDVVGGVIVLACYPFIIAFMRLIGYTASDESAKRHDGFVAMAGHFLDALRGMGTLRAFGASKAYGASVYKASERYRSMVMKTLRIATLSSTVLDLFATGGLAAVAIMLGFRLVEGTIAFLPALVVLMLVPEYFLPIKAYANDYHASLDGKSALDAMMRMTATARRRAALACGPVAVRRGEHVAVVGRSGAGKTTFLDAVAGLVDLEDGGAVEVCSVGGAGFGQRSWQRRVAYIPQHPYILSGSLRDNVALSAPGASDDSLREALGRVGLSPLLEALPEGLDTVVGTGGRELSGGEAHRVALARALADGERDVWLLDEPGSDLDIQTELELRESLLPLMEGRTVLVATHRLHWLDDVDRVIDLDAGRDDSGSQARDGASAGGGGAGALDGARDGGSFV